MLHLRVYGVAPRWRGSPSAWASRRLALDLTRADAGDGSGRAPVTADIRPDAADAALANVDDVSADVSPPARATTVEGCARRPWLSG